MKNPAPILLAVAVGAFTATAPALASVQLATKAGCMVCHAVDQKVVGPALKDIAVKYKARADALPYLTERVRKGGPGVWGPVPMPPSDDKKVSDADLKKVLAWILALPK